MKWNKVIIEWGISIYVCTPKGKIWPDRLISIEKIMNKLDWKYTFSIQTGIEIMRKNLGD